MLLTSLSPPTSPKPTPQAEAQGRQRRCVSLDDTVGKKIETILKVGKSRGFEVVKSNQNAEVGA